MSKHSETVGAHLPAPLVFAGLFAVGLGLNGVLPHAEFTGTVRAIGWGMAIVGFGGVGLPGIIALRRAGTSPNPNRPTTALVVTGPYRFTRNPLYLSMALIYAGIALAASFLGALVLLPVAMAIVDRNAVLEEAYLERRFGDAYRAYKARVRRWV
ncbi:MAG TPA: isoprenylcysteine carboxylmethyltransferase family protein [Candidatus Sulfopaludibacter sp.]|nr:isoprenylcysteine carboxylmethyltransferase family protein [Candidatus Sulfopaludibacter sp.]